MTNFTPAQLEAWAGLGPWDVTKSAWDERHYVEGENTICYMYALREDDHAILHCENHETNAALIAAAPDLARLVLERDAEIAELRKVLSEIEADCEADYPPSHSAIKYAIRQAMKETSDDHD